jgi:hypothetical protein
LPSGEAKRERYQKVFTPKRLEESHGARRASDQGKRLLIHMAGYDYER